MRPPWPFAEDADVRGAEGDLQPSSAARVLGSIRLGGGGDGRRDFVAHHRFRFAHGQAARHHFPRDAALRGFVGQRDERARVAHAERAGRQIVSALPPAV